MRARAMGAMAVLFALFACAQQPGVVEAPASPVAGVWISDAGRLELRAADSVIVADKGVLPVDASSIWIADERNVYQVLEIDFVNLQLARARDPIGYSGSKWPLAVIGASAQVYGYVLGGDSLCLETSSFKRCFHR